MSNDITSDLLAHSLTAIGKLDAALIERAVDLLERAWRTGGTVLACGNGGSASTASHFAADLAKYTIVGDQPRVRSICLNDNVSAATAWNNDVGFHAVFAEQAVPWLGPDAVVIGFSVHGGSRPGSGSAVSSNLAELCCTAKARGASVIGITGFDGGAIGDAADVHLNVAADQEPLATPLIESVHVLIHHALCASLRARIEEGAERS